MIKKTITYTDYDGNQRTEDFYFHLSKAEVAEMELSIPGGLAKQLKKIVEEQDTPKLIEKFKELILKAYGIKSDDAKRFIKSKELSDAFMQTEAYSELFMELANDPEAAKQFVNGILPQLSN
jgi:Asp-tRNA(Asn)/Glu-tRNA(Gln) amidotransferase B subunit